MKKIVCLMLLAGMLGACNATREDLGLERKVPDASKVSEQKQLLLPPNYDLKTGGAAGKSRGRCGKRCLKNKNR